MRQTVNSISESLFTYATLALSVVILELFVMQKKSKLIRFYLCFFECHSPVPKAVVICLVRPFCVSLNSIELQFWLERINFCSNKVNSIVFGAAFQSSPKWIQHQCRQYGTSVNPHFKSHFNRIKKYCPMGIRLSTNIECFMANEGCRTIWNSFIFQTNFCISI